LSQFIDDFEGLRSRHGAQRRGAKVEAEVQIIVTNQISNATPKKITLTLPPATRIGELKEQIGESLTHKKAGNLLCLLNKGKDLTEDLKTLKDFGMKSLQPDGTHSQVKIILTLKSNIELSMEGPAPEREYTAEELAENLNTLRAFLGDLPCSEDVAKLALKKCQLNLEEALCMLTNPDQVADLDEEVRREDEANEDMQLMTNQKLNLADDKNDKDGLDENGG
jgi:hypothetical protein